MDDNRPQPNQQQAPAPRQNRRRNSQDNYPQTLVQKKLKSFIKKQVYSKAPLLIGVGGFFFIIIMFFFSGGSGSGLNHSPTPVEPTPIAGAPTRPPIQGFTLTLTGPTTVDNGQLIQYTISYEYDDVVAVVPLESITIYFDLPQNATYESASGASTNSSGTVSWPLENPTNQTSITLTLRPTKDDILFAVKAYARTTAAGAGGDIATLLPPQSGASSRGDAKQQEIASTLRGLPNLIAAYQEAEAATGLPWQILAGIHYREGDFNPNGSLVSGRPIGNVEPDIPAGSCTSTYTPGKAVAIGGGCGFRTFADSAVYAAEHFKGKIGGKIPQTYEDVANGLARYNGYPGNSNCHHGAPWGQTAGNCPPRFIGDDNPYVMNFYDAMHEDMYVIYAGDGYKDPYLDSRAGTLSAILGISKYL